MLLAEVPRPSHHEEKISAFLMGWAKEQSFSPARDSSLNVMFDVPATQGMENKPLVILQVHLDMISIGPDLEDVHTPNEVLYLKLIPKTWRLLEGILAEVG